MPTRVSVNTLNASSIDIINTIRANAPFEYQNLVPEVTSETDIPKVGQILMGYPALANTFIEALINRIALVRVKSATFNNAYKMFKKGYLEYGEIVEEVFINIIKARTFSAEKAEQRELKRSLPDVKSAFHAINWRVQYPITIQDEDLRQAFLSANGVTDFIAKLVDSIYTAVEYDEFLLFKYLLIKTIAQGNATIKTVSATDFDNMASAFRGTSNLLTFPSTAYNKTGVLTSTPKDKQYIFMDAAFSGQFDVEVLARAFNMDKAEYMGKFVLIDDWSTFDNDRFSIITSETDAMPAVTANELSNMSTIKAVIVDEDFFQVYDNLSKFTVKYVASGMYWNYFYNVWKIVSTSPFSNIVAFSTTSATTATEVTAELVDKSISEEATVLTFNIAAEDTDGFTINYKWDNTSATATAGVAVHPYGVIIFPPNKTVTYTGWSLTNVNSGIKYTIPAVTEGTQPNIATTMEVGDTIKFTKATS